MRKEADETVAIEGEGGRFGLAIATAQVRDAAEIEQAIDASGKEPDGAVLVLPDSLLVINRARISDAAVRHRMPVMTPFRIVPEEGKKGLSPMA
ncbi:MAG: hypothetical protein K2Y27_18075 [Xanthobacteraceae bacterium]|nr:hypothetical protein [Xanthobacteraceae bacterium]